MADQQNPATYQGYAGPQAPAMGTYGAPTQNIMDTANEERIQEIAEAIIDEKWSDLVKNVELILNWKESVDSKIAKIYAIPIFHILALVLLIV